GGKWTVADELSPSEKIIKSDVNTSSVITETRAPAKSKKLSYKFQKEFDELPQKIEQLEIQLAQLQSLTSADDFYTQPGNVVEQKLQELAQLQLQLDDCFERWAELEDMQQE